MENRSLVMQLTPPINQEELAKFKQFASNEEKNIIQERDRIHNLPKRMQEEYLRKLDKDQFNKSNKFFISNEMSLINQRLHEEKKAPLREKQVKNFSENQNILSTIEKMDKFGTYNGPAVYEYISNEKGEIMRVLRGELFQPEFKYLQANQTYNIRKAVIQEQRNAIQERKFEQQLQPGNQRSQYQSSHSSLTRLVPKKNDEMNIISASQENEEVSQDALISKLAGKYSASQVEQNSASFLKQARPHTQGSSKRTYNTASKSRNSNGSQSARGISVSGRKTPNSVNHRLIMNEAGLSDSTVFSSFDQNLNQNIAPYSTQNLKFYQRYSSPEGSNFFQQILNLPNRPLTQQQTSRYEKFQEESKKFESQSLKISESIIKPTLPIDLGQIKSKNGLHYKTNSLRQFSPNKQNEKGQEQNSAIIINSPQKFYELGSPEGSSARTAFTSQRESKSSILNMKSSIHLNENQKEKKEIA